MKTERMRECVRERAGIARGGSRGEVKEGAGKRAKQQATLF